MPEPVITTVIMIIVAYLAGSICSAIPVAKIMGLPDPRGQGSGNPGATNMLRIGGKKAALITLLGDMLKGIIPVIVARILGVQPEMYIVVGLAAFLGHLYPLYFRFQGGKGVATAIGVLLAVDWTLGLFTVAVWLGMAALLKISSLSALTAFVLTPVFAAFMGYTKFFILILCIITALLIWRHRSNISNLLHGTEGSIKK